MNNEIPKRLARRRSNTECLYFQREEDAAKNRYLLIVDVYNSHVILQVVCKAVTHGLDTITLPSHTSHCLQPLDEFVF
jgi:hypothetical protein